MEALGPLLVLVSIPLAFRWIPQNRFYGFRVPATLRNESVWYDMNALCARHMILLGMAMITLEFLLPRETRVQTLGVLGAVGLATIIAVDWRRANRLERERT